MRNRTIVLIAIGLAALLLLASYLTYATLLPAKPAGNGPPPLGSTVQYSSSVDGFPLSYSEWRPAGFDPNRTYALSVYLHPLSNISTAPTRGGYGNGLLGEPGGDAVVATALSDQFLLIAPNTRTGSGYYVDSPYSGPQGQDLQDAITHEESLRHVGRVYLFGFSMGATGTLAFALHHPTEFAGIGVVAPASDLFEALAYHIATASSSTQSSDEVRALLTTTGGLLPNQSASAASEITYLSALRFNTSALADLPIYLTGGSADDRLPNDPALWPYQQINDTVTTSTCLTQAALAEPANCTAPLAQRAASHPGQYSFRYVFVVGGGHSLSILDAQDLFGFWLGDRATGVYVTHVGPAPT